MFKLFSLRLWLAFFALACLAACAAPVKHVDYTAFKSSRPRSILLLPPENATGNFTKIIQRVPVRIALPQDALDSGRLRAGLSVVVDVDTRTAPVK